MSKKWSEYSLQGCLFENRPSAAPELKAPPASLPDRVDLRTHCPPVENQLTTQSCVANAVVGALEFHQKKAGLPLTDLSRLFVYYNARILQNGEGRDQGTLIHHGMAAVLAYGACEERLWPFRPSELTRRPPPQCYENAVKQEAVQYARTPRGDAALSTLANGLPIVFGMYASLDYYEAAAVSGLMPKPGQVMHTRPNSGHSMLIVGYDMTERTYLVRNSWGDQWADKGYCRIPFETMEAFSQADDFWTIGAIEQTQGFKLAGPSMTEAMKGIGIPESALKVGGERLGELRSEVRTKLAGELDAAKKDFRSRIRGDKP
jgi:C1A family cysteine protease